VDTDREPRDPTHISRARDDPERLRVAPIVAQDQHPARSLALEESRNGIALRAGAGRPELDHAAALEAIEGRTHQCPLCHVQRVEDRPARPRRVTRRAVVEGDGGALELDEQPGRLAECIRHGAAEAAGWCRVRGKIPVGGDRETFGGDASWKEPVFEAVVPEIPKTTDPHAPRDVDGGTTGEDDDAETLGPLPGEAGEASERAAADRLDDGAHRIGVDRREGAVEVAHDQQRRGRGHQVGQPRASLRELPGHMGRGHRAAVTGAVNAEVASSRRRETASPRRREAARGSESEAARVTASRLRPA